jgi:hypothetical protein
MGLNMSFLSVLRRTVKTEYSLILIEYVLISGESFQEGLFPFLKVAVRSGPVGQFISDPFSKEFNHLGFDLLNVPSMASKAEETSNYHLFHAGIVPNIE